MKVMRIRFKRDGTREIDPTGFTGPECKTATAPYERALGTPVSTEDKPELYETVSESPEVGA